MADEFAKGLGLLTGAGLIWMVLAGWYRTPSFEGAQLTGSIPSELTMYDQLAVVLLESMFWLAIFGGCCSGLVSPRARTVRASERRVTDLLLRRISEKLKWRPVADPTAGPFCTSGDGRRPRRGRRRRETHAATGAVESLYVDPSTTQVDTAMLEHLVETVPDQSNESLYVGAAVNAVSSAQAGGCEQFDTTRRSGLRSGFGDAETRCRATSRVRVAVQRRRGTPVRGRRLR